MPHLSLLTWARKQWNGNFPLPLSFWGFGIVVWVLPTVLNQIGSFFLRTNENTYVYLAWLALFYSATTFAFIWWGIGSWRSATKTDAQRNSLSWSLLAKVVICILAIRTTFVDVSYGFPQFSAVISDITDYPQYGPRGVKVLDSGKELAVYGFISQSLVRAVDDALTTNPNILVVSLDSVGGSASSARQISDAIRSRSIDTLVERECDSACTVVFISGKHRRIREGARLGFHSMSVAGRINDNENERYREQFAKAGVSAAFITKAISESPQHLWFPPIDELKTSGVVTDVLLAEGKLGAE